MKKRLSIVFGLIALCAAMVLPGFTPTETVQAANAGSSGKPEVTAAVHHDVSQPLRDIPNAKPVSSAPRPTPHAPRSASAAGSSKPDGAVRAPVKGTKVGTTAGLNIAGVGQGDYGFTDSFPAPDTNGAIGVTQYVQTVSASFAVFRKSDGALLLGPVNNNTLWAGFGGGCQNNNDGEPIVLYDKAAGRWFLMQFSVSNPATYGYLECVAVSKTSDATGEYYRYAFAYSSSGVNEVPEQAKAGVWPDGYYVTYNIFDSPSLSNFIYAKACAFDRAKMIANLAAAQICFNRPGDESLLPSDLGGTTAPPAGSPNFLLEVDPTSFTSTKLLLYKFHVDFVTPTNATFSDATSITVASYADACTAQPPLGGPCIPQPGTGQQLDSLGDRLMFRLAYRNFGDHESLVLNHSVIANGVAAVRWYEIRDPNGTPSVYQQQTFGGDAAHRWMGSIAMDKQGNIALGYSMSSDSIYPQIVYTGRLATDPLSTMEGENLIQGGAGSALTSSRWGDYTAMSVDPVDDCTFWYSNAYLKASGDLMWSTRIASFKFPSCATSGPPPPPTGLHVTGATNNSVTWGWTNADPSAPLTFTVDGTHVYGLAAGTTSFTLYGIAYGSYGCLAIAAYNASGTSAYTPYSCSYVVPYTPYKPHYVPGSATTSTVSFAWNNYDALSSIGVFDGTTFHALGVNASGYTATGITPGYYACVEVAAYNASYASPYSPYACGFALPLAPASLHVTGHTATTVSFAWTIHDPYSGYAAGTGGALFALPAGTTTYTVTGLTSGSYGCLDLAAYNASGASSYTGYVCGQAGP